MGQSAKPAPASVKPSTNPPNFPCTRSLRVLVADDHEMVRFGLCAMLQSQNIEVCAQAKDGQEAMFSPDLIILDISMPVLGGIEAAQQIRVFLPLVPILFFSTHKTSQVVALVQSVGAQGFVAKDQMAATLLGAIEALREKKTFFSF